MTETRTQGQRILTQVEVEADMVLLDVAIQEYVARLDDLALDKAEAKREYEVAFAKARRRAGQMEGSGRTGFKSADEREDFARVETEELYRLFLNAEAYYDAAKKGLEATRDRLSAKQTLVRVIADLTGMTNR